MSLPAVLSDPVIEGEFSTEELAPTVAPETPIPSHVASDVLKGTSALALGIFLERGAGFLANILAARLAGASTFGAYSLAIGTANNVSTYAAGGIGATATRFSGKYPFDSSGYATLARVLTIVSLVSAIAAAFGLWFGAAPIAHLLHKTDLTNLLHWAAISAAGMILLECARGFFVGQRRLAALVLLSLVVGTGMVTLLPWMASTRRAVPMIVVQSCITLVSVAVCLLFARQLNLFATTSSSLPLIPMLREVWSFGFVQLVGLVGVNLAGWWLTALVARSDVTLEQISFFSIASQLRNLTGLLPGLLTEGSYSTMADTTGEHLRTPQRVMALCTYVSTGTTFTIASLGIVIAPWLLHLLYGSAYRSAGLAVAVAFAIALVHMGNAPAAARLTIASLRYAGIVNTIWALLVACVGTLLLYRGGGAALAMSVYFAAHIVSSALVLFALSRKDHVPAGLVKLFILSTGGVFVLLVLSFLRERYVGHGLSITAVMFLLFLLTLAALVILGKQYGWFPTTSAIQHMRKSTTLIVRRTVHTFFRRRSYEN
ncbi:oligosaccharide flippase family protein [Granulicella sp. dw_53]|uniref:lipopolysaccharide biosynthesis protein n=1 Tax=Granulicella sp. dw_53 TaxID=2719792 RepID=UPI001BD2FD04|nr:oligosaccharide flippase family protein [Granulicella sp. dw_53]